MNSYRNQNRGFSMLEVLIAIVIITFGLLGLAGLQVRIHQAEIESYQRAQALVLMYDIANRINTNRKAAGCYAITTGTGTPYLGVGNTTTYTCTAYGTAQEATTSTNDIADWDKELKGVNAGTGGLGAIVGAKGCVSYSAATQIYTVAVSWQGTGDTVAPVVNCGNNLYGPETRRRTVSTQIRIATLT